MLISRGLEPEFTVACRKTKQIKIKKYPKTCNGSCCWCRVLFSSNLPVLQFSFTQFTSLTLPALFSRISPSKHCGVPKKRFFLSEQQPRLSITPIPGMLVSDTMQAELSGSRQGRLEAPRCNSCRRPTWWPALPPRTPCRPGWCWCRWDICSLPRWPGGEGEGWQQLRRRRRRRSRRVASWLLLPLTCNN